MEKSLSNLRVAAIATDGFEESELIEPLRALREEGAQVDILSIRRGSIQAFRHHGPARDLAVDRAINESQPGEYQAALLPGGALSTDVIRDNDRVLAFIRAMQQAGRPIAAVCHAPWILVSADLVRGRKLTSYPTIRDDIRNAGGEWLDQEVVVDGNWVTSRSPEDLPAFNREMLRLFSTAAEIIRAAA